MEVERALLEGEQVSEMALLQREKEVLDQLNEKIGSNDKTVLTDKSQVTAADMLSISVSWMPLLSDTGNVRRRGERERHTVRVHVGVGVSVVRI